MKCRYSGVVLGPSLLMCALSAACEGVRDGSPEAVASPTLRGSASSPLLKRDFRQVALGQARQAAVAQMKSLGLATTCREMDSGAAYLLEETTGSLHWHRDLPPMALCAGSPSRPRDFGASEVEVKIFAGRVYSITVSFDEGFAPVALRLPDFWGNPTSSGLLSTVDHGSVSRQSKVFESRVWRDDATWVGIWDLGPGLTANSSFVVLLDLRVAQALSVAHKQVVEERARVRDAATKSTTGF